MECGYFRKNAFVIFARIYFVNQNNFSVSIPFCAGFAQFVSSFFLFPVCPTIFPCIALLLPALGRAQRRQRVSRRSGSSSHAQPALAFPKQVFHVLRQFFTSFAPFFPQNPTGNRDFHIPFSAKSGRAALVQA
jgi:hypothetical protein